MGSPRPPEFLAVGAAAGQLPFVQAIHSSVAGSRGLSVACWIIALRALRRAWIPMLGVALSLSPALAQRDLQAEATAAPGFSRIDISSAAAVSFEGTGAPGDRIALHVDGQPTARTNVDAQGQWRVELEDPLAPGDYTATALSIGHGTSAAKVSEDVRIAIPHAEIPVYASRKMGLALDDGPPDAATMRRASELARDATLAFSELTSAKQKPASAAQANTIDHQKTVDPELAGDETHMGAGGSQSIWRFGSITAWLARARHDYEEVLVAGLSDPRRWRPDGDGNLKAESRPGSGSGSPISDWPENGGNSATDYLSVAAGWLQRSNRDYHDFLVRELVLRGIEDIEERQVARAAMSRTVVADASSGEPASSGIVRQAQEQHALEQERKAEEAAREQEEQRLAKARELEEERAAVERRDAEERARQRQAEEAEAIAIAAAETKAQAREEERRLAEVRRQEQEQEQRRARHEQRIEEALQAFALNEYLATRPQDTRPQPTRQPDGVVPKPEPMRAEYEARQSASEQSDVVPPSRPAVSQHEPAIVAPVPTRVDAKTRERLMVAIASKRGANGTEDEGARPPLPQPRPLIMAKAASRQAQAKPAARRKPSSARKAKRKHHAKARLRGKHARNRWCKDRRAGRAIRPPGTYVIAYGDTLWSISERHYGAGHRYRRIRRADGRKIVRPHRIYPCQRVWLPRLKRRAR